MDCTRLKRTTLIETRLKGRIYCPYINIHASTQYRPISACPNKLLFMASNDENLERLSHLQSKNLIETRNLLLLPLFSNFLPLIHVPKLRSSKPTILYSNNKKVYFIRSLSLIKQVVRNPLKSKQQKKSIKKIVKIVHSSFSLLNSFTRMYE